MISVHDLLREKPSLFMLFGWSSVSFTSLMMHFTLRMQAARSSETLVSCHSTTWYYNPKDLDLYWGDNAQSTFK
jgi:hypothetical protein